MCLLCDFHSSASVCAAAVQRCSVCSICRASPSGLGENAGFHPANVATLSSVLHRGTDCSHAHTAGQFRGPCMPHVHVREVREKSGKSRVGFARENAAGQRLKPAAALCNRHLEVVVGEECISLRHLTFIFRFIYNM